MKDKRVVTGDTTPMDRLCSAIEFMDMCRSQNNSGETGAYRDAVQWIESAAREAVEAYYDAKVSRKLKARARKSQIVGYMEQS